MLLLAATAGFATGLALQSSPFVLLGVGAALFLTSDLLEQVTFFGKQNGLTTGLIVEKQAGCSLYANVNDAILKADFTKLPPELMMCSVALSLTDTIDIEGFTFDE